MSQSRSTNGCMSRFRTGVLKQFPLAEHSSARLITRGLSGFTVRQLRLCRLALCCCSITKTGRESSVISAHSWRKAKYIASMSLSRDTVGGHALTVLNLDSVPPPEILEEIQKDPDISNVKVFKL